MDAFTAKIEASAQVFLLAMFLYGRLLPVNIHAKQTQYTRCKKLLSEKLVNNMKHGIRLTKSNTFKS